MKGTIANFNSDIMNKDFMNIRLFSARFERLIAQPLQRIFDSATVDWKFRVGKSPYFQSCFLKIVN